MPRIFVSYCRADGKGGLVKALVDELTDEMSRATGWPEKDVFYLDVDVAPGVYWSEELVAALRTCDVFVALLSPRYFQSETCGKEWGLFERRRARHRKRHGVEPAVLIPILWEEESGPFVIPPLAKKRQYFGPKTGLRKLVQNSGHAKAPYIAERDQLVEELKKLAGQQELDAADEDWGDLDDAVNAFASAPGRPTLMAAGGVPEARRAGWWKEIDLVVAAATAKDIADVEGPQARYGDRPLDWAPYQPNETLALQATKVAVGAPELLPHAYGVDSAPGGLLESIAQAGKDHRLVVLLVDPWTLCLDAYSRMVGPYDQRQWKHTGVVVVWDEDYSNRAASRAKLEAALESTLSMTRFNTQRSNLRTYSDAARTRGHFARELEDVILYIRGWLTKDVQVPVREAGPVDQSESDGKKHRPRLEGPGGET